MTTLVEPFPPWLRDINRFLGSEGGMASSFVPPADVLVDDEGVTVYMDVPGVGNDKLSVEIENDVLTVRGERSQPYGQDGGDRGTRRIERTFGRFERSLRVPRGLNPDAIEASVKDGVLMLRIPKPESLKPHRIQVKGGDEAREIEATGSPSGAS